MKHYLLPKDGSFYKANLHTHSKFSDGSWTVEQIKDEYKKQGYSIVAYTDHDIMIPHHELDDENFLALTGVEFEITEKNDRDWSLAKTCHFCAIAKDKDNETQPIWCGENYLIGHGKEHISEVKVNESEPSYYREYSPKCINEMAKICKDKGFYVTYNHPTWSEEDFLDYTKYTEFDAMEILNGGCITSGYDEYNPRAYDDMLRYGVKEGKTLGCVMTDDNHNWMSRDDVFFDSFVGFTCIKADKLEYNVITKALEDGNYYCSQAPVIKELWIEDNKVHIETEPARRISIIKGRRSCKTVGKNSELTTCAEFALSDIDNYFRLVVEDDNGKHANTNAYFIDDLVKKGVLKF